MANNNSQRVAAFLLAFMFLLTTVGAAGYVVWELNSEDTVVTDTTTQSSTQNTQQNSQTQQQEPEVQDQNKLANFTGPVTVAELRFDDEVVGDGEVVQPGDTVTIHYTGALASDGTVFDSSVARGQTATFPLDNLIAGWQEGIPGMKVGGKRRLFIPSAQGYGPSGTQGIPPNSDLVFDIELFATER